MRKNILFIANWKMNISRDQSTKLLVSILPVAKKYASIIETVVAPSFLFLNQAALTTVRRHAAIQLCAQDCFWEQSGAYTGEVSPDMLADIGCTYVLIGHSERRLHLSETNEMIRKKIACVYATKRNITPVLCIGETAQQKKEGESQTTLSTQLSTALNGIVLKKNQRLVIAYEPVWAIGTGSPMTPEAFGISVGQIQNSIKKILGMESIFRQCSILYGGSVTPKTAGEYVKAGGDGVLVGGASQSADSCSALIQILGTAL